MAQDVSQWPLIDPLPSYGRGRDKPGGRYSSLIGGSNLTDVVITGMYHSKPYCIMQTANLSKSCNTIDLAKIHFPLYLYKMYQLLLNTGM
jgi:hypothetical protein